MQEACEDTDIMDFQDVFVRRSLIDTGFSALAFGSYLGLIVNTKLYPALAKSKLQDETCTKKLVRMMVAALMIAPFFGLLAFGPEI